MLKNILVLSGLLFSYASHAATVYNLSTNLISTDTYDYAASAGVTSLASDGPISGQLIINENTYSLNLNVENRKFYNPSLEPGFDSQEYNSFNFTYSGNFGTSESYVNVLYDEDYEGNNFYLEESVTTKGVILTNLFAESFTQFYVPTGYWELNTTTSINFDYDIIIESSSITTECNNGYCTSGDEEVSNIFNPNISSQYLTVSYDYGLGIPGPGEIIDTYSVSFTEVTTVPVPAAAWMFVSALVGLVGVKRK
ncbi:VPLPA-CTERM sorting domain-containing protein [Oceanicoccus sp. KOV_DT_Chl]|uniref:VPLPA-CTERM sorting domain-containing protein n=1 Tax=Oceanicoccus sp. KOV_DT_Chl TaxID=1904639 RepID=UPI000C7ABA42|nr:VPLPA-CTERM sorting domain-containing protein [Oceanicoccus sp. KOV_DT_Chl]